MISIIYIHKGNPYYLLPNLLNTRRFNRKNPIILLGDEENEYVKDFGFLHYKIDDYMDRAGEFEQFYTHQSPNAYSFELFCIQRWFVASDFCKKNSIDDFLICDSDAFLFCDADEEYRKYTGYDFTICRTGTPCFVYFTCEKLQKFTEYIMWCYSSAEGRQRIDRYAEYLKENNKRYGISDMSSFVAYEKFGGAKVAHVDVPDENNIAYDHNFQDPRDGYVMVNGYKRIAWIDKKPYEFLVSGNTAIEMKGIHLQGISKLQMYKIIPFRLWRRSFFPYLKEYMSFVLNKNKS